MYAVAGVSGNTGSVVANALLGAGMKVRVIVRDAAKGAEWAKRGAEVAIAPLDDAAALATALTGVQGAYLLVPPNPVAPDFAAYQRTIVDAIVAALSKVAVPHVAFLSSIGANHAAGTGPIKGLHYAESRLATLKGTRFSHIRAAYFMENTAGMLHAMKSDGVFPIMGLPEPKMQMVATLDIGHTAAEALLNPPKQTEIIELSAAEPISYADLGAAYGAALGRTITLHPIPLDAVVPTLTGFGLSASVAGEYREMIEGGAKGLLTFEGGPNHRRVYGKVDAHAFAKGAVG